MTGYTGKTNNKAPEVVGQRALSEREAMLGPMPGEIVDYDAAKGTATIRPLFKRKKWDGSELKYPDLLEVPIDFPRTGSSAITMPLPAGTKVSLAPTMRSAENYDEDQDGNPSDARSFSLSDMRATVAGGDSLADPLQNVDPDNTHVRFNSEGTFGLRGSPDGKFKLEGSEGNIYALTNESIALCRDGFQFLSTEPALIHTGEYASIAAQLTAVLAKLEAMAL